MFHYTRGAGAIFLYHTELLTFPAAFPLVSCVLRCAQVENKVCVSLTSRETIFGMSSLISIDEVASLTVPKLKAELTRLNQPLAGLKRKAQLADALTVSATDELKPKKYVGYGGGS